VATHGDRLSAPFATALETVGYEELCESVDLNDLAAADGNAIAHVAPSVSCHPSSPVDLGGLLGRQPDVPDRFRGSVVHPEAWWAAPFQAPALYAASLREVLCFGGLPYGEHRTGHLLLAGDRFIVPDSHFARGPLRSLPSELVASVGEPEREAFQLNYDSAGIAARPGLYYFGGAAWGHFGHFLLESLSRWWLLARLPESVRTELRFVLYNEQPLESWQLELLAGLGVRAEQLVYLTEPMRFEQMIVPSAAYSLHSAVASAQAETWERIGQAYDRGDGPERVYLSRSRFTRHRTLVGEAEVERRFQAYDFTVVHPEELSIAEQVAVIRQAQLIAGSAGSAMYLSAFARRGARKLIISPRHFTFRDDQLISYVRGEPIAYVLCPQGSRLQNPRTADYRVAANVLEAALEQWIASDAGGQLP